MLHQKYGLHLDEVISAVTNNNKNINGQFIGVGTKPIVFSLSIVIIVFLPIFTLEGVEGKMFTPMALTVTFSIVRAIFYALVIAPVFSYLLLKQGKNKEFFLLR